MTNGDWIIEGELLDEHACVRLDEFCARLRVERHWIVELVAIGALEPRNGADPSGWEFPLTELSRARTMTRLVEELDVNLAGAAIIVDLLEQRAQLARRVRQFAR